MTLVDMRTEKRLTQESVSEKLCIDRTAVSKWETGASIPATDKLAPLAALYGVSVDELLNAIQQTRKEASRHDA